MKKHLVVVGGGQAALQTVQSARQLGYDGDITLVADELDPPYQRPPLSKQYLAGKLARERLYLRPASFYADQGVRLMPGRAALEIQVAQQGVRLDDDSVLRFSELVLATGSRARRLSVPGAELAGIHYVRTIPDIDALRAELEPGKRLVIVGGGYIGLEAAAVAVALGLQVTVLEAAPRLLARVVCEELAEFYTRCHTEAGVAIQCGTEVTAFAGEDRVLAVETRVGTRIDCDLVIAGIGVLPNVELAAQAGLECDDGILVDSGSRTADPNIFAAGDCSNHPHPFAPHRVRLESVNNAVEQGKAAAASLLGHTAPFESVPWFWSDQYDLKLQIAGLALDYEQVVVRGNPSRKGFAVYYLAAGVPIAVDAVNSPRDFMGAKKLIAARRKLSAQEIADPEIDLTARFSDG